MKRCGVVCHFHAEKFALGPFIEAAEKMFDEIVFVSSPMDGTPPDPETIKIAEASGHKLIYDTLSHGFGALRTRCISYSSCEWVMILDADEVLHTQVPEMRCFGDDKFPQTLDPKLSVTLVSWWDQRQTLRNLCDRADVEESLAICVSRRHWMDAPGEWNKPAQNWECEPDWQLRLVKNSQWLCYDPTVKMHERLLDVRNFAEPKFTRVTDGSLYLDHYSWYYKGLEPAQNAEDAKIYEELAPGCVKEMWLDHYPKA